VDALCGAAVSEQRYRGLLEESLQHASTLALRCGFYFPAYEGIVTITVYGQVLHGVSFPGFSKAQFRLTAAAPLSA
jgi:hypothetical protein